MCLLSLVLERIETPDKYINVIKNSRNPPFTMIESADKILHDFDESFKRQVCYSKDMNI